MAAKAKAKTKAKKTKGKGLVSKLAGRILSMLGSAALIVGVLVVTTGHIPGL